MENGEAVEEAKLRCVALRDRIHALRNLSSSSRTSLLRLANAELSFLNRLSSSVSNPTSPFSFNIGHLESVVHVLEQHFVSGVSRVCKPISINPFSSSPQCIYADIICSVKGKPVWILVSDRNPKHIYWQDSSSGRAKDKGLRTKIQEVVDGARRASLTVRPSSIILFFANGLDGYILERLSDEFEANHLGLEFSSSYCCAFDEQVGNDWVNVLPTRNYLNACALEIKIESLDSGRVLEWEDDIDKSTEGLGEIYGFMKVDSFDDVSALGGSFCTLIEGMKCWTSLDEEADLVNFDTTALIAVVSGISNGGGERLLAMPENDLRSRFKGNYKFMIDQVNSEIHSPIHVELSDVIREKSGIICQSVYSEVCGLISMCGGPNEKLRANYLLKHVRVVPDNPSPRLMGLPNTRKLALKNKVAFGTGDQWCAPTLTANMAFVRAVLQTGMSLFTMEHRPRALIGD